MSEKSVNNNRILIFGVCFLAYTSIYIARLNLTAAAPALRELSVLSAPQIGMLGSVFSTVYAVGRLLNGQIGDRRPQYWLLHMRFNLVDNTYAIKKTEYFGSKETLLETINRKVNMVAIPEKSFADVMCQVCKDWAAENKEMEDPKK